MHSYEMIGFKMIYNSNNEMNERMKPPAFGLNAKSTFSTLNWNQNWNFNDMSINGEIFRYYIFMVWYTVK